MNNFTLPFSEPEGVLSFDATARAFADSTLGKACAVKLDGMRTRFTLDRALIHQKVFQVIITFEGERLSQLELLLILPTDKAGWDGWSEAGERQRKLQAEQWLAATFGLTPTPEPFDLDGQKITPFQPAWDHPRTLLIPGAKITSYYDSKAAFAGILCRFEA